MAASVAVHQTAAALPAEPCSLGMFEDFVDVFLLAIVFGVGWVLVRLARRCRRTVVPKAKGHDLWTPVLEDLVSADASKHEDTMASAEEETSKWAEAALPSSDDLLDDLLNIVSADYSTAPFEPSPCADDEMGLIRAHGADACADMAEDFGSSCAQEVIAFQAAELSNELEDGAGVDAAALAAVVRAHCDSGDLAEALNSFREFTSSGFEADAGLFNALLFACQRRNSWSRAHQLLAEMQDAGVAPTSATLAALLRLHGARGAIEEALELFEAMPKQHGFEADAHAHHALIVECLAADRSETAREVFSSITVAGMVPIAKTYEALITASMQSGDLGEACEFVRHAHGIPPAASPEVQPTRRRATLERKIVERLLTVIGRRRQAAALGLPLASALQEAAVDLSTDLVASLSKAADAEALAKPVAADRSETLQRWRSNFGAVVRA